MTSSALRWPAARYASPCCSAISTPARWMWLTGRASRVHCRWFFLGTSLDHHSRVLCVRRDAPAYRHGGAICCCCFCAAAEPAAELAAVAAHRWRSASCRRRAVPRCSDRRHDTCGGLRDVARGCHRACRAGRGCARQAGCAAWQAQHPGLSDGRHRLGGHRRQWWRHCRGLAHAQPGPRCACRDSADQHLLSADVQPDACLAAHRPPADASRAAAPARAGRSWRAGRRNHGGEPTQRRGLHHHRCA